MKFVIFYKNLKFYVIRRFFHLKNFLSKKVLWVLLPVLILTLATGIFFLFSFSKPAKPADQIQTLYRIDTEAISNFTTMPPKQQKEQVDIWIQKAKEVPVDGILWDHTVQNNKLISYLSKQAKSHQLGVVVTVSPEYTEEKINKLQKKWNISGICYSGVEQNGLTTYPSATPLLMDITLPDTTQIEFYSQWTQGKRNPVVIASTNGQNHTTLYKQLNKNPQFIQTDLLKEPTLSIGIPQQDISTTAEVHFVAGTADPNLPLTVNGQSVAVQSGGIWGIPMPLQEGENPILVVQGEQQATITITRKKPSEGNWTPKLPEPDDSEFLEAGEYIQVTSPLASLLKDYQDDDSILQTIYQGAVVPIKESVSFVRGKKSTHAYRVAGGWLLAKDIKPVDATNLAFTQTQVSQQEQNHFLFLEGATPLVAAQREDTQLTLTFPATSLQCSLPEQLGFATLSSTTNPTGELSITFSFETGSLWGWSVDYTNQGTKITLKEKPVLSANPTAPLEGIRILLDPGHGLEDLGAIGPAGVNGPNEKDLNLATALATKQRLEQLGATVLMSRQDDSFPTLAERNLQLRQEQPDIFVSVHHNSIPLTRDVNQVNGVECYYFYPSGKLLAENLSYSVSQATHRKDRGKKYNYFYVTRSDICPAVLLETAFVPNSEEYASCIRGETISKTAFAIASAIQSTLEGISLKPSA